MNPAPVPPPLPDGWANVQAWLEELDAVDAVFGETAVVANDRHFGRYLYGGSPLPLADLHRALAARGVLREEGAPGVVESHAILAASGEDAYTVRLVAPPASGATSVAIRRWRSADGWSLER